MPITYRRTKMTTLNGDLIDVNVHRFLGIRIAISNVRLWLAKKIVPYGHTVIDEADVSHYLYLQELVRKKKTEGRG